MMIRKQIYIPKDLDQQLAVAAKQASKSETQIIREALAERFSQRSTMTTGEALLGLAKLGEKLGISGPTDLSERHDDYLYGDEK
jgi:predicted transcriptional regulator